MKKATWFAFSGVKTLLGWRASGKSDRLFMEYLLPLSKRKLPLSFALA